jgi:polyphosphate kinase
MVRNLDHRIEVAVPVTDKSIKRELRDIINIQLNDNVKARIIDNNLSNNYVLTDKAKKIRSQVETYRYLSRKQKEIIVEKVHNDEVVDSNVLADMR